MKTSPTKKEIILGVTGGIACYKSLDILRKLKDSGHNVTVVMTESAQKFIQPLTFQTLSNRSVASSLFDPEQEEKIGHIQLAQQADLILIAPATANIIAKIAHGLADDLLSTIILASKSKKIIAPAMNNIMWQQDVVQENIIILKKRGWLIIPPEKGFLACGTSSIGRLANQELINTTVINELKPKNKDLSGKKVLITAGPTIEKIDPVRFISNFSSGKMGYAIAEECIERGAEVTLVSGPVSINVPHKVSLIPINTADEMLEAVLKYSKEADLIIKTAAVSDYRVESFAEQKIKKKDALELRLVKNTDILFELGKRKKDDQFLVGFAAESENIEEYGLKKLSEKKLDMIVVNDITKKGAGFSADNNEVILFQSGGGKRSISLAPKREIAKEILDEITSSEKWITCICNP